MAQRQMRKRKHKRQDFDTVPVTFDLKLDPGQKEQLAAFFKLNADKVTTLPDGSKTLWMEPGQVRLLPGHVESSDDDNDGVPGDGVVEAMGILVDLWKSLISELDKLGYEDCKPVETQKEQERCRIEGTDVIVAVETEEDWDAMSIGYDIVVYCAQEEMKPIIFDALLLYVKDYGKKELALLMAHSVN